MRVVGLASLLLLLLAVPLRADEAAPAAPKAPGAKTPTWEEARKLANEGKLPRAIVAARAIFDAQPKHARAARLLQDLLAAAGKTEKIGGDRTPVLIRRALSARVRRDRKRALTYLADVMKDAAAPQIFRLDLAQALADMGKASQAESEVERFLKAHPGDVDGLTALGLVLRRRGKYRPAREALEAALAPDPGVAAPAVALAELHAQRERPEEARAVLTRALGVYPRNATLLLGLADDQMRTGELDLALRTLTTVLGLPAEKSMVHARLAEVHRMRKAYPEADRSAQAALAIDPKCVRALRVSAFVKQKADDLEGALAIYQAAAKLAPDWAQIHADLGFVHMLRGKTLLAERALRKALELEDELVEARRTLGIVMFQRGKPKPAKKELGWVLKRDKEDIRANRYMGYVLLDEGKSKAAIKHFTLIAELDPKDADCLRMTGNAYILMGKLDQAIEAYQEAIGRDPKFGWAYFDMGKALEGQERWEDAAAAYRKAIELDAKLAHPHLYLAELLDEVLDEPEEALTHYERYLELGGHGEGGWIKRRAEQLERDIEEDKKNKKNKK